MRAIMPAVTQPRRHLRHRERCGPARASTCAGRAACASSRAPNGRARTSTSMLNLPGVHNVLNALAAIAVGREVGRAATRRSRRRSAEFTRRGPPLPALRRGARSTAAGVHAGRRLRPPPGRDGGDARRGARRLSRPAPRARLPAAPLHAHARPLRGFRARALDRRRAGARRRLSGGRGADRRRRRPLARARACASPGKVEPVFVEDIGEMRDAVLQRVRDGDVVLTMGAGSIGAGAGSSLAAGIDGHERTAPLRAACAARCATTSRWRAT